MPRLKVLITQSIPNDALKMIQSHCQVDLWESEYSIPKDELYRRIAEVEGLYCLLTERVDAELLNAAPKLKVVSNMAVGFDNIDVRECTRRNLPVGNTPGVLTETTADLAFTLICAAARRVVEGANFVQNGRWVTWKPTLLLGQDLYGATLGVIGLGRIGAALARRARGFNMQVLYFNRTRRYDDEKELGVIYSDLDTLLQTSDFVSLHTPLTAQTRGLINERALSLMKPSAVLVNTARGAVVDSSALYTALSNGVISYAALDVTDPEPLPSDHPLIALENCIVVPHIGSASVATRTKMAVMAAENLLAGLAGKPLPNCVNPEVYQILNSING